MKKITFSLVLLLFCATSLMAQQFDNASAYLDFVSSQQQGITKSMWNYTKAIAHDKSERNIDRKRHNLIQNIDTAIKKIKKAGTFEGEEYKKQVIYNLELYQNLLQQNYDKIIDMKKLAETSYDNMEAYINMQEMTNEKMAEAQELYEKNFREYAAKHEINIVDQESELGKKMKASNAVFDYYNMLHLIFFKVNFTESELLKAIEKNDVAAIQQNANALRHTVQEGFAELEKTPDFKKDNSLVKTTEKAFKFYQSEVDETIPQIIDFLVLNEDFKKIQKALEDTPKRKRTQKQVDTYNAKVKAINNAVNDYNALNNDLYEDRQVVINTINQANSEFLARHIPKE